MARDVVVSPPLGGGVVAVFTVYTMVQAVVVVGHVHVAAVMVSVLTILTSKISWTVIGPTVSIPVMFTTLYSQASPPVRHHARHAGFPLPSKALPVSLYRRHHLYLLG